MLKLNAVTVLWICSAIVAKAAIPEEAKPLSREELAEFLGKAESTSISWSKVHGVDCDYYYGRAKAPLSGEVGIYFGYAPGPGVIPDPTFSMADAQLGKFPVKWRRKVLVNGRTRQELVSPIGSLGPHNLQATIWIEAKNQSDLDKISSEISQLPPFATGKTPPGFQIN